MPIEEEIKMHLRDVLIAPYRSTLDSHSQVNQLHKKPTIVGDKLDFTCVSMMAKGCTSICRSQVNLERTFKFRSSGQEYTGIPIIASDTVGTFEMARALSKHSMFTTIHKNYSPDEWVRFAEANGDILKNVALSTGIKEQDQQQVEEILARVPNISFICIQPHLANGQVGGFAEVIKTFRAKYPTKTIMAGSVVYPENVEKLILAGADIVKVGIGGSRSSYIRKNLAVGYPQYSAVLECVEAAHSLGGHIISGGCTVPGDICKAFGAGADFVRLGSMLVGNHVNNIDQTILNILGDLGSACASTGSADLKELSQNTTFVRRRDLCKRL